MNIVHHKMMVSGEFDPWAKLKAQNIELPLCKNIWRFVYPLSKRLDTLYLKLRMLWYLNPIDSFVPWKTPVISILKLNPAIVSCGYIPHIMLYQVDIYLIISRYIMWICTSYHAISCRYIPHITLYHVDVYLISRYIMWIYTLYHSISCGYIPQITLSCLIVTSPYHIEVMMMMMMMMTLFKLGWKWGLLGL